MNDQIFGVVSGIHQPYNQEYTRRVKMTQEQKNENLFSLLKDYLYHQKRQNEISDQLRPTIIRVANIVNKLDIKRRESLKQNVGYGYCFKIKLYFTKILVDEQTVSIKWEENWSYGGHDHGWVDFPTVLLHDKRELKEYIVAKRAQIRNNIKNRKLCEQKQLEKEIALKSIKLEELKIANS